jgi:hypothetical protein
MPGKATDFLGCLFPIAFLIFGVVQVYAAYLGIEDALGTGWAVAALVVSFLIRSSIFIVVGAFLGAMNVWEWHWALAALFAAPGLAVVLPAMAADFAAWARSRSV